MYINTLYKYKVGGVVRFMPEREENNVGVSVDLGKVDLEIVDGKITELKKLSSIGSGYWLYIPKPWVELLCVYKDGSYWVKYEQKNSTITIKGYKYQERQQ